MLRPRSLRARLSLGIALLVLAVLVAVGLIVYYGTEQRLMTALDDSLRAAAAQAMAGANVQNGRFTPGSGFDDEADAGDPRVHGLGIVVLSPAGATLARSGTYPQSPPSSTTLAAASRGDHVFQTRTDPATGRRSRVLVMPLREDGATVAVFSVAMSQEPLVETMEQLRVTLSVLLPLAALAAALLAYLLIASMLRPLTRITRTAATISPSDLSQRLGVPHSDDEIGRLATSFDAMLERLEDSFESQRRFVADASHELRTPVAAVRAIVAVTRGRPRRPPEYEEALDDIAAENERLNTLVERLLELARSDAGGFEASQRVGVTELLRDVVASMGILARARGLGLVGEIDDGLAVDGDADALVQLFVNLVDNAIKYTDAGTVSVSASRAADTIQIDVVDTGRGIADADLPHVFERFYRSDSSRASDGTGLGLAVAQETAAAHGGTIQIAARSSGGTRCRVTLPAAR
jgi:heavy metal sensor kinase